MQSLAVNKRAHFDYTMLQTYEAGIKLHGHEVKSVKNGHINLKGAYVSITDGQLWLKEAHISRYAKAGKLLGYDPDRPRVLLVHKAEINHLVGKLEQKGLTLVPLRVYTRNNRVKLAFALAKGKKKYDKRQTLKDRDIKRDIQRSLKQWG